MTRPKTHDKGIWGKAMDTHRVEQRLEDAQFLLDNDVSIEEAARRTGTTPDNLRRDLLRYAKMKENTDA